MKLSELIAAYGDDKVQLMVEPAPFDPADPIDAMAESFRLQVIDMALGAQDAAIYRDLGSVDQFRAFAAGVAAGLVCVAFASVKPEGRGAIMAGLGEFLAYGRVQAEGIDAGLASNTTGKDGSVGDADG